MLLVVNKVLTLGWYRRLLRGALSPFAGAASVDYFSKFSGITRGCPYQLTKNNPCGTRL